MVAGILVLSMQFAGISVLAFVIADIYHKYINKSDDNI